MNVKRCAIYLILMSTALISGCDCQNKNTTYPEKNVEPVDRYQLFQGYYTGLTETNGVGAASDAKAVFKIDTVTGETWEYAAVYIEKKDLSGWKKIANE